MQPYEPRLNKKNASTVDGTQDSIYVLEWYHYIIRDIKLLHRFTRIYIDVFK